MLMCIYIYVNTIWGIDVPSVFLPQNHSKSLLMPSGKAL